MDVSLLLSHNSTYNVTSRVDSNSSYNEPLHMGPPIYLYVYATAVNSIVFFVGVVGNTLVVQVVARVRAMRKRMNYFLVSLSVADLLVLLVGLPTALYELYGKEKWLMGEAMCKLVPFLENASHHCSVLTLLAIGFERYYAICHPLRQTVGSRVASTTILIPAVWIVSCVVSIPFAVVSHIKVSRYYDDTLVDTCRTDMTSKISRIYIIFISVAFFTLPLLTLTALYSAIILTLRSSTAATPKSRDSSNSTYGRHGLNQDNIRNAHAVASRRQVIRMMLGVMCLYFLCLFPLRCVQLWQVFSTEQDLINLGFIGYLNLLNCVRILVYVNSAGNPIIYGLLSSNFRAAFIQSLSTCRTIQTNYNRHTTYYSNNCRQPQEQATQLSHVGNEVTSVNTGMNGKENIRLDEEKYSPRIQSSHSRSSSQNSMDRVVAPLLSQAVSTSEDMDVIALGDWPVKHGLAYV